MRKYIFVLIILAIAVLVLPRLLPTGSTPKDDTQSANEPKSFEECVKEGNGVFESNPPVCITKTRRVFPQKPGIEPEILNKIKVNSPRRDQIIKSPLQVTGEARGMWFFEAQFSAKLFDDTGNPVGVGIMTADGEWMTENYVPFTGTITFKEPTTEKGKLILEKNNPSGLLENAEQLIIPVKFK